MPPKNLTLPGHLLKQIGVSEDAQTKRNTKNRWKSQNQNRKDKRKNERQQKRSQRISHQSYSPHKKGPQESWSDDFGGFADSDQEDGRVIEAPTKDAVSADKDDKSNSRKRKRNHSDIAEDEPSNTKNLTRAARGRLANDDAEIEALEKKLGIKGRKKLPKSFEEDGLDGLLGGVGDSSNDDEKSRAKREADEWLSKKRTKAAKHGKPESDSGSDEHEEPGYEILDSLEEYEDDDDDDDDGLSELENAFGHDLRRKKEKDLDAMESAGEDDDFSSFDESDEQEPDVPPKRVRENPYVAPAPATSEAPKYVPPSRRSSLGKDADLEAQVRRKSQGPINRVTEANLISIVGEVEKIYREHPRGVVTNILTDLLMAQICDSTSKPDTLLVLSAGFIAALYKSIGVDFAAHFLTTVVGRFQKEHDAAREAAEQDRAPTKETSNLITVLAELYMFRVVGSNLIFDYVRWLLSDLSELNAELLLRCVRMAGPQLRKDDPLALKDIVSLIRPAVNKIGEANLSVRAKFMIETISDLKNNKIKAGSQDMAVLTEHVTRMKKLLGTMDASRVKATEPMRVGLQDIQDVDKSGKWWLVGASWGGKKEPGKKVSASGSISTKGQEDSETLLDDDDIALGNELDIPDYAELAREQGMNTDVRRAIFIALVAAADYHDAYLRILKLQLNKHNRREIANVLVQCSSAQQHYNPYYTLVANKFCGDSRIKYAFQDTLWTLFRRLGEPLFGEEPEDEDEDASDDRRLINAGKMFGNLVVESSVGLNILKPLNMAYVKETTSLLIEVMLITVLQGHAKNKQQSLEQSLVKVFGVGLPSDLARGVRYFMRKKVRKSDLVKGKEAKKVKEACEVAEGLLEQLEKGGSED